MLQLILIVLCANITLDSLFILVREDWTTLQYP